MLVRRTKEGDKEAFNETIRHFEKTYVRSINLQFLSRLGHTTIALIRLEEIIAGLSIRSVISMFKAILDGMRVLS